MKNGFMAFFSAFLLCFVLSNECFAVDIGLITGGEKGTYYQFGLNIKELAKRGGINLNVYPSQGSIENIYAVFKRKQPQTQMGIVQADALAFVARVQNNPALKKIAKKIKMVFPLYNEEVHLLGRGGISDFDGLSGRKVAIGREGSGTYFTARLLFEIAGIRPGEILPIDTNEALAQLKAGEIDAMFYVDGYPVKLFTDDVSQEDGLHLIPILNESILRFYPMAEIPAYTYDWQSTSVNTVSVKAVLVSFNFRGVNCERVGRCAQLVAENLDWLAKNGHPKWKSVDLEYPLKGWQQYDCVKKYLARTPVLQTTQRPAQVNPVLDAVKGMLGT